VNIELNGKFKTRKFVIISATLLLTYIALFAGKLTGDQVVTLVPWLIGIFAGANVVAKHNQFTENK
jgi:hypothetical protein